MAADLVVEAAVAVRALYRVVNCSQFVPVMRRSVLVPAPDAVTLA